MAAVTIDRAAARRAAWLNWLLPGGGLILLGAPWSGWLLGLLFAASADFALSTVLLFPDDYSPGQRLLAILVAAGVYVAAQWRLAHALRDAHQQADAAQRRQVLAEVQELLARGANREAVAALRPLATQAASDLHVAYRLAQALTAAGDPAAGAAWRRVAELDPHGIYKQQMREPGGGRGGAG